MAKGHNISPNNQSQFCLLILQSDKTVQPITGGMGEVCEHRTEAADDTALGAPAHAIPHLSCVE